MKAFLRSIIIAAALLFPGAAFAQSACPQIIDRAVLTAAQWNSCFQAKQDLLSSQAPVANQFVTGIVSNVVQRAQPSAASLSNGTTGTGAVVLANGGTLIAPNLGTPASGILTNATGLPVTTGISGLGTGVSTWLGTPSSANLLSAVTDETGIGLLVFNNNPSLTTPTLNGGTANGLTTFSLANAGTGAFNATILHNGTLTAGRTLTLNLNDAARAVSLSGDLTLANSLTTSGNFGLTLTQTGTTNVTLPTSGTLYGTATGSITSAQLAASLTNETGTGAAVFGTSPTIGTPAISGGTIDGAVIGGTTPAAGNFTTGSFSGNVTVPTQSPGDNSTKAASTAFVTNITAVIQNYLSGLTLSTAGSSSTYGIANGVASDSTNTTLMTLASAYTKTTSAWAVGSGNGSLDTGSIANSTWYHVWLIRRPDTGVVDVLLSLSATSPTMPTNYTQKRRIGSMLTNGSAQWVRFFQDGDNFRWETPAYDYGPYDLTSSAGSDVALTARVPTGIRVRAFLNGQGQTNSGTPIFTARAVDEVFVGGVQNIAAPNPGQQSLATRWNILTSTLGQYLVRATAAGGNFYYLYIGTLGWVDRRGQDG